MNEVNHENIKSFTLKVNTWICAPTKKPSPIIECTRKIKTEEKNKEGNITLNIQFSTVFAISSLKLLSHQKCVK